MQYQCLVKIGRHKTGSGTLVPYHGKPNQQDALKKVNIEIKIALLRIN